MGATADEVLREYGVAYVVVPNQPNFAQRLSSDSRFVKSYENSNLLIFQVKAE